MFEKAGITSCKVRFSILYHCWGDWSRRIFKKNVYMRIFMQQTTIKHPWKIFVDTTIKTSPETNIGRNIRKNISKSIRKRSAKYQQKHQGNISKSISKSLNKSSCKIR
ncbi:hypothetical protein ACTNEW_08660 [Blautia sp. HCP3S3_G3]|uniref:hypothetical protein n=1 Tax=Blautia sp. HCP3S3_G3 TaxID=3438913 RepID=UPI003F8AA787